MFTKNFAIADSHVLLSLLTILFLCPPPVLSKTILDTADEQFSERPYSSGETILTRYQQACADMPNSYEAHWKLARACRWYAHQAKTRQVKDWKKVCAEYGHTGMCSAEKAIQINPKGVEGHLYFGLCAGSYADGANILSALIKGLKDEIKSHLKTAYTINKTYQQGLPVLALGRFWHRLPHLLGGDKQKALQYYQEAEHIIPQDSEYRELLQVFMGELLLDLGQKRQKAYKLLRDASKSKQDYYRKRAIELLHNFKSSSTGYTRKDQDS
jgi:tetratricopeptide (TPR) repeat protein